MNIFTLPLLLPLTIIHTMTVSLTQLSDGFTLSLILMTHTYLTAVSLAHLTLPRQRTLLIPLRRHHTLIHTLYRSQLSTIIRHY
jgi:hypothetical protein